MTDTPDFNLQARAGEVRALMLQGKVTYDQALDMLAPFLEEANRRGALVAKRFKKKWYPIPATKLLR